MLAVGFTFGEEDARGASSVPGFPPDSPPRAPAEIRLGLAFSRYVLDFSAKGPLSDYVRASALKDRVTAERDLFETAVPPSSTAGSREDHAGVLRDSYAQVMDAAEKNVATRASSLLGMRWEEVSSVPIEKFHVLRRLDGVGAFGQAKD